VLMARVVVSWPGPWICDYVAVWALWGHSIGLRSIVRVSSRSRCERGLAGYPAGGEGWFVVGGLCGFCSAIRSRVCSLSAGVSGVWWCWVSFGGVRAGVVGRLVIAIFRDCGASGVLESLVCACDRMFPYFWPAVE